MQSFIFLPQSGHVPFLAVFLACSLFSLSQVSHIFIFPLVCFVILYLCCGCLY